MSLKFIERHPDDASRVIERYPDNDKALILSSMPASTAATLLQSMTPVDARKCLVLLDVDQAIAVLQEMPPDIASACIRRVTGEFRERIINKAKSFQVLKKAIQLLRFPPDSAGTIMDPEALALQKDMTIKQTIAFIKRHADKLRNQIYTVDSSQVLTGYILIKDLILSDAGSSISMLIRPCEYTLAAHASLEMVTNSPGWRQTDNLPVVDNRDVFLGALTRTALENRLSELSRDNVYNEQSKDILLGLAETFMETCSEILSPEKR